MLLASTVFCHTVARKATKLAERLALTEESPPVLRFSIALFINAEGLGGYN